RAAPLRHGQSVLAGGQRAVSGYAVAGRARAQWQNRRPARGSIICPARHRRAGRGPSGAGRTFSAG
nr:hypothetical protein [Tanacetum cinerariifolium]